MIEQLHKRNYVLCLRGPKLYGFVHRTFLDYFSATGLVRRIEKDPDYTIEHLRDQVFAVGWREESWREVLRLIASMVGERQVGVLISYLTHEAFPRWRDLLEVQPPTNLALALECCAEVRNLHDVDAELKDLLGAILEVVTLPGQFEGEALRALLTERILPTTEEFRLPRALEPWFVEQSARAFLRTTSLHLLWPVARLSMVWISSRALLIDRAKNDPHVSPRSAAIQELARGWQDHEDTRTLLVDRAKNDPHVNPRHAAIQEVARGWQDHEETRPLLSDSAQGHGDSSTRGTSVDALTRWLGDLRATALLSQDLDGVAPFLDPREPIPDEHIEKGAKHLNITVNEARQILADCEPALGWNPLDPPSSPELR